METEILGHDHEDCGVKVIDKRGHEHRVTINWDGEITHHFVKEYPTAPEDKTEEEQLIVDQVATRALFAAHQNFDANLIDPGWDPRAFERGRSALEKLSFREFEEAFRDFYDAMLAPEEFVDDPDYVPGGEAITKVFGVTEDDEIGTVEEPIVFYETAAEDRQQREIPEYHSQVPVAASMPRFSPDPNITFRDNFPGMLYSHLGCVIRDIYLNMGEQPPPEYQLVGPGKCTILGHDENWTRETE